MRLDERGHVSSPLEDIVGLCRDRAVWLVADSVVEGELHAVGLALNEEYVALNKGCVDVSGQAL